MNDLIHSLLWESVQVGMLFPFEGLLYFQLMIIFGFDVLTTSFFAVFGLIIGHLVNYIAGRFFIKEPLISSKLDVGYDKARGIFSKYLWWVVLFSAIPGLGALFSLFAGLLQLRLKIAILMIFIGNLSYILYLASDLKI